MHVPGATHRPPFYAVFDRAFFMILSIRRIDVVTIIIDLPHFIFAVINIIILSY